VLAQRRAQFLAMRLAVDDAAMRRGWVWPIMPFSPRPSSRQIFGSWVVLPEPVSPDTMMTWCFAQRLGDLVAAAGDRQVFGEGDRRQRIAECALGLARGQLAQASGARRERGRRDAGSRCGRGSPSGRAHAAALARLPGEVRAVDAPPRQDAGHGPAAARLRAAGACARRGALLCLQGVGRLRGHGAVCGRRLLCVLFGLLLASDIVFYKYWCAKVAQPIIMRQMENPTQFVQWLRSVAPYIHAFRGKTFVVAFPGELVSAGALPVLAQDLSLLVGLGIRT
jgi:hypothetical protein